MAETPAKKQKIEDYSVQYFKNFLSDYKSKKLVSMLRGVVSEFGVGLAHSSVFFLRVNAVNANSNTSFKNAWVETEVHRKDSCPLVAPLCLFYLRGYGLLEDLLNKIDPKVPDNLAERRALGNLLQFLSNSNEQSVLTENKGKCKTESVSTLTIRLAQHLLVPLVPHKTFVIDSCHGLQFEGCCQVEHPMSVVKGDTSFGCPNGWHGRADVLLHGDEVPLTVVDNSEDDVLSVTSDSSVEIKNGGNFTVKSISHVIAQTIVNSFLQQRKTPSQPCSLVPGIGICSEKMIVFLYDCVEDVLLTTGPLDLYAQMGLCGFNARAVIILWLMLNHSLFRNKTPDRYKSYTADFHHVVGPVQLEGYKNESELPFITTSDEVDILQCFKEENASFEDDLAEEINIQFPERRSVSLKYT